MKFKLNLNGLVTFQLQTSLVKNCPPIVKNGEQFTKYTGCPKKDLRCLISCKIKTIKAITLK